MNPAINYCRICLDKNFVGQSIFDTYNSKSLPEIIMTISGIEIYKMDKFSQLICFNCAGLLIKAIEIREKCLESDIFLHQYQYGSTLTEQFSQQIPLVNDSYEKLSSIINNDDDSNKTTEELWRKIVEESSEINQEFSHHNINNNNDSIELEKEFDEFIANLISDTDDNDIFSGSLNTEDDNGNSTTEYDFWSISSQQGDNLNNSNNYYDEGEPKIITTNNNNQKIIIKTKTNKNNKIYKCEHCMKIIKNRTAYERHKRYHLQQKQKQELELQQQQQQQQQQNNINHKTLCPICQKYVKHKSNLKRHLLVHRNQKMDLICSKCNEKFIEPNELYEHLKTHKIIYSNCKNDKNYVNNINNNNYVCSAGIQIYETADSNDDFNNNNNNKNKYLQNNSTNEQRHEDENEYILVCKLCKNYKTISLTLYSQHMKIKHQINDTKPFKCRICEMSFASKQGMLRHIDNIHENNRKNLRNREKKFLCNTCGKFFYTNFHLEIHIRSHTGEKPFKCQYCEKTFAQMSGLRMHTLTHTGEKPFACKICGKSFTQYGHVKEHYLIHSNEKNHVCNVCGHSFRVKGNLTAHMLVHSGKKPFSCGHCGKEFIQRTKLRVHVNKYHQPEYSDDNDDATNDKVSSVGGNEYLDDDIDIATGKIIEQQNIQLQIYNDREKNDGQ